MNIVIRADASVQIGSGHVMRCLTLAEQLHVRGVDITFVCRGLPDYLGELIRSVGYKLILLSTSVVSSPAGSLAHSHWLGVSQEEDARETLTALGSSGCDWLIVDHYALDVTWESVMRRAAKRIMVIDDLADRKHSADILLDQNIQSHLDRYAGLVPNHCLKLLGPHFSLLRPEFFRLRASLSPRDGRVSNILVFIGGGDKHNYTARVLDSLALLPHHQFVVHVVMTKDSPHLADVTRCCEKLTSCQLHVQTTEMASLMARADFMIGGAGSTTWERCCLGVPSLLISIADNQNGIGRGLARHKAAIYLGNAQTLSLERITSILRRIIERPGLVRRMAQRAETLVDGRGAERVAAALIGRLRLAVVTDAKSWINKYVETLIDEWRNAGHEVIWTHDPKQIPSGDCAFFLSCSQIVGGEILARNTHNLVVHESDLPKGRGWSPLTWQVLEGCNRIPVTLFEAKEKVDSGVIYLQEMIDLSGGELVDELRSVQADKTLVVCRRFVIAYPAITASGHSQCGEPTYYARRRAVDSCLDIDKSLREQFNLLRVVDNLRYPAYFEVGGQRYVLRIEKD